jgi:L-lysine exporter family protein LysE/ArgO
MDLPVSSSFITGFGLCLGLIVAIGAQNAFVLRQGLRREHVLPIVVFCFIADALLITLGVAGMARLIAAHPMVATAFAAGGAAFLLAYGARAAARALRPGSMALPGSGAAAPLRHVILQLAGFTFLNPHTFLDTVVLVGSVGAQQAGALKWYFTAGAASASGLWFAGLGYGARLLAPLFQRPVAWRVLDGIVAAVMFLLAGLMAWQAFGT